MSDSYCKIGLEEVILVLLATRIAFQYAFAYASHVSISPLHLLVVILEKDFTLPPFPCVSGSVSKGA